MKEPPLYLPIPRDDQAVSSRWVEGHKIAYDHNKHFSTISTACILLVATFVDKFAPEKHGVELVWTAIVMFLLSLCGSVCAMSWVEYFFLPRAGITKYYKTTMAYDLVRLGMILAFFGGVACMAVFVLLNLPN